ncbi:MAG: hypothetical protein RL033_3772 [Pseudomonadota bacterium]
MPHAGLERVPTAGQTVCPWPEGKQHGRKFLQVYGGAISHTGKMAHGEVCVWAEYEAPTHARPVDARGHGPRFVQTPLISVSHPEVDTDPWIFHPGFVWSLRQHQSEWQQAPQPQNVQPQAGDIVLFGSPLPGARDSLDWVLDTVLVVKRRLSSNAAGSLKNHYGKLVEPALRGQAQLPFVGQPQGGAARFSFAPCKVGDGSSAHFERPSVNELFRELRVHGTGRAPTAAQARTLTPCRPSAGMEQFWKRLTELIWSEGLALGADFDLPAIRVLGPAALPPAALPTSTRQPKSSARRKRARAA